MSEPERTGRGFAAPPTTSRRERGMALIIAIVFALLAVVIAALFLDRTHYELKDSRLQAASVRSLFKVHGALSRAHTVINTSSTSAASLAANQNLALADPETAGGVDFVSGTNRSVRVRTDEPSDAFDLDGEEVGGPGDALPADWYVLEARVFEPVYTANGQDMGVLKLVRQYVRDGTPLSNNFVAVVDDDLGLGGSPVNPGKPAEGEIHTNRHLYIMTPNPYYANRLMAVDGVSYIAGASEANTVYLHPDNNFSADPLYLPLPESLTSNPDNPDDTLKAYALGANPVTVALDGSNPNVSMNGVTGVTGLKMSGGDTASQMYLNYDADGVCQGVCVEGNVDTDVVFVANPGGDPPFTMDITLVKGNDSSKWVKITDVPAPDTGVVFFDTMGSASRFTDMQGAIGSRVTVATTANVSVSGSLEYVDSDGDPATKLVYSDDLEGVDPSEYGNVPEIPDNELISNNAVVEFFANKRPPGQDPANGDGFYDGNAVLGVVAVNDIILMSTVPQNAELAGAFVSLQKRLTLDGMFYNGAGNLSSVSGSNPFYVNNGGRSSIRRFGSLVSYKRPATAVVNGGGSFLYGFKRGFSLFDEDMKSQPPPFFPKDQRPQYLGWELRSLGVRPITG